MTRGRVAIAHAATSATPGSEIELEGAYIFNGADPTIHSLRQMTPFEVTADGALGIGMFRKTKGRGQIVVEVLKFADDKQVGSFRASDDGVVFGENLIDHDPSFAVWRARDRS